MNQFNQRLDQAKKRQKRIYLLSSLVVLTITILVAGLFVVSRGTRVDIIPPDAKEFATIRVVDGLGFSIGDSVYSFASNPSIHATAPGFKPATKTIDAAYIGKVFPLELIELPGRLIIELLAPREYASETKWQINERTIAPTDTLDLELEAGTYAVTADNPYFETKQLSVDIKRREKTTLTVDLQPISRKINIVSKPSGAAVFINDESVGQTPVQLNKPGGRYALRVSANGYADTIEQLTITRDAPQVNRDYQLEFKKENITLNLTPKGGTLLINGIQVKQPLLLNSVASHRLTYMKAGYYQATQTIRPKPGQENKVTFRLKPEIGQVDISSSPTATVWINNKNYGTTPIQVSLPAVPHQVVFKKEGYRSVTKSIQPKGASAQKISATLLTEEQAKLKESPRTYTNSAGVKLKLFLVNDQINMGAPRSEKGQRANEFQRTVRLSKPFYASVYEITNQQFAAFKPQKGQGVANHPVTSINWQEAAAYCNWLSKQENLNPFYIMANGRITGFNSHANGYRLLSEAEWEWLARKSGKVRQTLFSWGNDTTIPINTANIADENAQGTVRFYVPSYRDGYAGIAPVGRFTKETSGLYDLAGNVSEWVHDVYSISPPLANSPTLNNPLGSRQGQTHVIKGANFRSGTMTTLRPAYREGLIQGRDDVGLRIGRYLFGGENE